MTAPASETAAQIAARYGLPLAPGAAVRQIPRGTSGQPLPVWRGNALRYPDPEDQRNRWGHGGGIAAARHAAALSRRAQLAQLHAEGLTDAQLADRLGVNTATIAADRKILGLAVNPVHVARAADRIARIRGLISAGWDDAQIAAELGLTVNYLRLSARVRKPAAPRAPKLTAEEVAARQRERVRRRYHARRAAAQLADPARLTVEARRAHVADAHARGLSLRETLAELAALPGADASRINIQRVRRDRNLLGLGPTATDLAWRAAQCLASVNRLNDIRWGADIPPRKRGGSRPGQRRSLALLARVVARHHAGETVEDIAAAEAIRPVRAARILRREGLGPCWSTTRSRAARLQDLIDRVARGESGAQIAAAWGCSLQAVYGYAHSHRVSLAAAHRPPPGNAGTVSPRVAARRERVRAMRQQGLTLDAMEVALGVSRATLSSDITALGIGGTSPNSPAARSLVATRPELVAQALALVQAGHGLAEVARRMDLPVWTASRLIRAAEKATRAAAPDQGRDAA